MGSDLGKAVVVAMLVAWGASAWAASVMSESVRELANYVKAASTLVLQTTAGLERVNFAALRGKDRELARARVETLSKSLGEISNANAPLVNALDFYVARAKSGSTTEAALESLWKSTIQEPAVELRQKVRAARKFAEDSDLVAIKLTEAEYNALKDNLRMRSIVVERVEKIPAPSTPDDVLQVESVLSHYKILVEQLLRLRAVVDGALRKLKSG